MEIKDRIINSCRELVGSRGLYNLTVDELAAHAGVSKRTVYRYFRSKEEIIETTIYSFITEMAGIIERVVESEAEPAQILNQVFENALHSARHFLTPQALNDLKQHYPLLWQKIEKYRGEKIRHTVEKLIEKGGNSSVGEINPKIITAVIIASINAVATPEFIIQNNLTLDETVGQLSKVFIQLLAKE